MGIDQMILIVNVSNFPRTSYLQTFAIGELFGIAPGVFWLPAKHATDFLG